MSRLVGVQGVLPPHRYPQAEITAMLGELLPEHKRSVLQRLHRSARVATRHLALPIERYRELDGFGDANDAYIEHAVELGAAALSRALDEAGLAPHDLDVLMFTTVTGVAAPSIDARIANRLGLRPDIKRVPMFGLGCVAGAAGTARLHELLTAQPSAVGALVSVELCSLTFQREDASVANLVASGLFGDGAAAVVAVGDAHPTDAPGPRVLDSRSHLYPDTERTMGWDVTSGGLRIVLDADVPVLVRKYLGEDVTNFLTTHALDLSDVSTWVSHPGGPKVIEAIEETLHLPAGALDRTWESLAAIGNLSSSSVLHVLQDTLATQPPAGTPGLMMAMGPGFCSELVLLEWA